MKRPNKYVLTSIAFHTTKAKQDAAAAVLFEHLLAIAAISGVRPASELFADIARYHEAALSHQVIVHERCRQLDEGIAKQKKDSK